jgi:hypothetical protein
MWMNCQSVYAGVTRWRAVETDIHLDLAIKKLMKYVSTLFWFILLSEKQYCLFLMQVLCSAVGGKLLCWIILCSTLPFVILLLFESLWPLFLAFLALLTLLLYCSSGIVGVHQHAHYVQVISLPSPLFKYAVHLLAVWLQGVWKYVQNLKHTTHRNRCAHVICTL